MGFLTYLVDNPSSAQGAAAATIAALLFAIFYRDVLDEFCYRQFPLFGKHPWEISNAKARARWASSAEDIMISALEQVGNCFSPSKAKVNASFR